MFRHLCQFVDLVQTDRSHPDGRKCFLGGRTADDRAECLVDTGMGLCRFGVGDAGLLRRYGDSVLFVGAALLSGCL